MRRFNQQHKPSAVRQLLDWGDFVLKSAYDAFVDSTNAAIEGIAGGDNGGVGMPLTFVMDCQQSDASVVVVSDSTSDSADEWVYRWAQKLAAKYPEYTVKIRFWSTETNDYGAPETIQDGSGPRTLQVYNFGISGGVIGTVLTHFTNAFTIPFPTAVNATSGTGPTMVLLSVGHNMTYDQHTARAQTLEAIRKIRAYYPAAAIVLSGQNPKTPETQYYAETLATASVLAELAGTEGLGYINVQQAFFDVGDYSALVPDGVHPSADGSELWAVEVDKHFVRGSRAQPIRPRDMVDMVSLPAGAFAPAIGSPELGVPTGAVVGGYLMDDATQEAVVATWVPPAHWRSMRVYVRIAQDGVTGQGVSRWRVDISRLRSDGWQNGIEIGNVVSTPSGGQYYIVTADITPVSGIRLAGYFGSPGPIGLPELIFRVNRMGNDAADVANGDMAFISLLLVREY